jgi:hypothetical protein
VYQLLILFPWPKGEVVFIYGFKHWCMQVLAGLMHSRALKTCILLSPANNLFSNVGIETAKWLFQITVIA